MFVRSWDAVSSQRAAARDTRSMFKSIQSSIQIWHAGLLAVVLISFGTVSYSLIARARYQEIDAELGRSVQELAGGLRLIPTFVVAAPPASEPSGVCTHSVPGFATQIGFDGIPPPAPGF